MGAKLKRWNRDDKGCWKAETLWEQSWGGKFDRLRDIEVGDVDGDGADEWIIATHDYGVVAVYNPPAEPGGEPEVIELDKKADTFVHEIEVGDINGDGKVEFFATPSDRNKAGTSQAGEIVMYRYDGETYKRIVVDGGDHTHAKEILADDLDGDGKTEFFSVLEAELENRQIKEPVKIRLYTENDDGTFSHEDVVTIDDQQTRFLVAGDFDGDGRKEMVAAAMKTGLYYIDSEVKGDKTEWTITNFDSVSSGFEHASVAHDMDGDGKRALRRRRRPAGAEEVHLERREEELRQGAHRSVRRRRLHLVRPRREALSEPPGSTTTRAPSGARSCVWGGRRLRRRRRPPATWSSGSWRCASGLR